MNDPSSPSTVSEPSPDRVLVLAPVGRDASLLGTVLNAAGTPSLVCAGDGELARELELGAGALLMTHEALVPAVLSVVLRVISVQPTWSDLPIVLLVDGGSSAGAAAGIVTRLRAIGNVIVLERPVRRVTLITAIQSALRARHRQYEIRDLVWRERSARRDAESSSLLKDEFLATVSHELRTPLNAILLWARLLGSGVVGAEKAMSGLRAIETSAEAQSKLIEDLLDVSRMIGGKLQVHLQTIEIYPTVQAAVEVVRPSAQAKRIELEAVTEAVGPVRADASRLQQVVWNLLSNAIKFTPHEGRVSIALESIDGHARIVVKDTGQGIDPQFLPHVFERFRQADATPRRLQSGLGLGLAISRQLIELHGGSIHAESGGAGLGSTFTVDLPLADHASEAEPRPSAPIASVAPAIEGGPSLTGVRVLLVEDDIATREAMKIVLSAHQADVTAVASAPAALEWLAAPPGDHRPHVLLSDLGLPGMDGYELLRRIRALERSHGFVPMPAVLVTAYARGEDRRRAREVGFAECVAKPLEPGRLANLVADLAGGNGTGIAAQAFVDPMHEHGP
jgi:signal transduction histidine kinase/CheY-like chemotaxis protein